MFLLKRNIFCFTLVVSKVKKKTSLKHLIKIYSRVKSLNIDKKFLLMNQCGMKCQLGEQKVIIMLKDFK